jgi:hypothetical protein
MAAFSSQRPRRPMLFKVCLIQLTEQPNGLHRCQLLRRDVLNYVADHTLVKVCPVLHTRQRIDLLQWQLYFRDAFVVADHKLTKVCPIGPHRPAAAQGFRSGRYSDLFAGLHREGPLVPRERDAVGDHTLIKLCPFGWFGLVRTLRRF